jgi:TolB-like protein/Tfp pilus assembly protein PilF
MEIVSGITMSDKKNHFFQELKRRNVYRVATVYAIAGWLVIQVADVIFPYFGLPDWIVTALIILTLIGFPIAVIMAWIFEMSPDGIVRTGSKKASENPYNDRRKKPLTSTIAIVVLLVLLAGQFIYFSFLRKPANEVQAASSSALSLPSNSIAVLPFVNLSEEKDNQYFSDGVMEAILNNLSMIRDLKVISRTSVEKYRNQDKSIGEIAAELEVANILEGSVQRVGDQVRVTAQLISGVNEDHIWADSYDRRLNDIFAIQSEIAQTIAENLEVIMTSDEIELMKNAPTSNLKAYELYLKAWYMAWETEEENLEVIGLCDKAIELDPEFGLAYALKGRSLERLGYYGYPEELCYDSAMRLQDLAIEKDPTNWLPYAVRAVLYSNSNQVHRAAKNIYKALELNPNNPWACEWLGRYLLMQNEYSQAIDQTLKGATLSRGDVENNNFDQSMGFFLYHLDKEQSYQYFLKALEVNPNSAPVYQQLNNCSMFFGDYDRMIKYALEYRRLMPNLVNAANMVAQSYLFAGRYEEAEEVYEEMLGATSEFASTNMVYAFKHRLGFAKWMNGEKDEGRKIMELHRDSLLMNIKREELLEFGSGKYYDLALIYAVLGQKEEALAYLRESRDHEKEGAFYRLEYLLTDPMLNNLREEPEFQEMLEASKTEQEEITRIFHDKLKEYHARKELKWLKEV